MPVKELFLACTPDVTETLHAVFDSTKLGISAESLHRLRKDRQLKAFTGMRL